MRKSFQMIIIFLITFILLIPTFVQATNINMNLTSNTVVDNTVTGNQSSNLGQQSTTDTLSPNQTNHSTNSATVSALSQLPEASLGLNNIINIILIVIGVLLILLGIAIMIRLKH